MHLFQQFLFIPGIVYVYNSKLPNNLFTVEFYQFRMENEFVKIVVVGDASPLKSQLMLR
jgi:hypothetical protein